MICLIYYRNAYKFIDVIKFMDNLESRTSSKLADLVFFNTLRNGKEIDYVGIYIGDKKFIHASSGRGITISNLNNNY